MMRVLVRHNIRLESVFASISPESPQSGPVDQYGRIVVKVREEKGTEDIGRCCRGGDSG